MVDESVLQAWSELLGEEHPGTITAVNNLGITIEDQGQLYEAAVMQKEVLEKWRRILGEEHPHTEVAIQNLAILAPHQMVHSPAEIEARKKKTSFSQCF